MAGDLSMTRAMAMRWRCPAERVTPRSPISCSNPWERGDELVGVGLAGRLLQISTPASGWP
jgi:hypothetical protein